MAPEAPQSFQDDVPSEAELIAAERRIEEPEILDLANCPSDLQLRGFAAGEYREKDPVLLLILDHLSECDACMAKMAAIRIRRQNESHALRSRKRAVFLAFGAALILVLVAFLAIRSRTSSQVAVIDLRDITRGNDTSSASVDIGLRSNTRLIRILLPIGSNAGDYDLAVFDPSFRKSPLLSVSASTRDDNGNLTIEATLPRANLRPGSYLLGIRQVTKEWTYYPLTIY